MRGQRANTGKRLLAIMLGVLWGVHGSQRPALATVPCSGFNDSASACPGNVVIGTIGYACNPAPGQTCPGGEELNIPLTAPADGQTS